MVKKMSIEIVLLLYLKNVGCYIYKTGAQHRNLRVLLTKIR